MRTAEYTDLQNNMCHYLDKVVADNEPLLVHRVGAEPVIVITLDEYNALSETEYIMRSPAMMKAIQRGAEDIREGRCITKNENETMEEFLERCTK